MKKLASIILVLATCLFVLSCKKDEAGGGGSTSKTAVLSVVINDLPQIVEVPEHQTLPFETQVASNPGPESALNITLGADESLVASYNAAHGTSYEMLPATAFEFSAGQLLLSRYNKKSTKGSLGIKGEDCTADKIYVLPVVIKAVSGSAAYQIGGAAYVLVKVTGSSIAGSGTQSDPYQLTSAAELAQIANLLVPAQTTYFKLMNNIDMTGVEWTGIDCAYYDPTTFEPDESKTKFISLDGNSKTISKFSSNGAFFTSLRGNVQNLTFDQATITGGSAGVLARQAGSNASPAMLVAKNITVVNSTVTSTGENAAQRNGGLISHLLGGVVENCNVACDVETEMAQTGGLIGRMEEGSVINCSATGNVHSLHYYQGGLIGLVTASEGSTEPVIIRGCHATGAVSNEITASNYSRVGGLIGQFDHTGTIEDCYATGNVSGTKYMGGGLLGVVGTDGVTVTINRCYATGNVIGPQTGGNWAHYGGLVGTLVAVSTLNISNCYATGKVVTDRYCSGFVGSIHDKLGTLNITNSFTSCDLSDVTKTHPDTGDIMCGLVLGNCSNASCPITCTGFVAWNTSDRLFSYPSGRVSTTGNYYGTDGSISAQATTLGWDTTIWDLSGNVPTLK